MVLDVPGSLSTPDGSPLEQAKPWENPHKMVVEEETRMQNNQRGTKLLHADYQQQ